MTNREIAEKIVEGGHTAMTFMKLKTFLVDAIERALDENDRLFNQVTLLLKDTMDDHARLKAEIEKLSVHSCNQKVIDQALKERAAYLAVAEEEARANLQRSGFIPDKAYVRARVEGKASRILLQSESTNTGEK